MSDIDAVAARLRGTAVEADNDKHDEGYDDGTRWAKQYADRDDLSYMSTLGYDGDGDGEELSFPSLTSFMGMKEREHVISVRLDLDDPYWQGFLRAASEVWAAVENLI